MAWGVAHFGEQVCIVEPGDMTTFAQLPVAALRLPREMLDVLAELGIQRVAQLLNLPREGLTARLGPLLIERIDQALGNKAELVAPHRAIPEIIAERQFEFPLERRDTIEEVVTQLLAEITAALAIRQHGVIQLECVFGCQPEAKLLISLFEASADPAHLLELLRMRLERTLLPGPVAWLRLSVLLSARLVCRQQELFAAHGKNHEREQSLLIDRLSSRLGREAVVRAQFVADAQPEYAFRFEPLAGKKRVITQERKPRSKKRTSEDSPEQAARAPPERPLLLEPRPVPLEVLAVAPDGPPMQFRWQGEQHRTRRSWGPEGIQTGWWRGRYIRRDYYRVESDRGQQYWLFRSRGQWFLHGIFD
jgi:protein ImuB